MNVQALFIFLGLVFVLGGIGIAADVRRNRHLAAQEESEIDRMANDTTPVKRGRGRPRKNPVS